MLKITKNLICNLLFLAMCIILVPTTIAFAEETTSVNPTDRQVFSNGNIAGVGNGPSSPTTFTVEQATVISYIYDYHYFNGGVLPGTISLQHSDGTIYGPWQTTGSVGQGGVDNAYWEAYPNVEIKAGTYTVIDSSPETWSCNYQSDYKGFTIVWGHPSEVVELNPPDGNIDLNGSMDIILNGNSYKMNINRTNSTFTGDIYGYKITSGYIYSNNKIYFAVPKMNIYFEGTYTVNGNGSIQANGLYYYIDGTSYNWSFTNTSVVPVTGITLDKTTDALTVGGTDKLTATVAPDNATNKSVKWTSSDSNIVTVDENGNLNAIGVGTATITCASTDGTGISATCEVTVTENTNEQIFEGYKYTVTDNKVTITKYIGSGGDIIIPSQIDGYPVTNIADWAFASCTNLTSVNIPNSVTSIGYEAFSFCSNLKSVEISNGLTTLGDCIFFYCTSLTSVDIPNSVTSIGYEAFDSCTSLTTVDIPSSVTTIGDNAFSRCTNLSSVKFLGNAPTMGTDVFADSSSNFKVYYLNENTGFATPTWNGYATEPIINEVYYTVTYDGNGNTSGTIPTDSNTYEEGSNVILLENTGNLEKTNYIFSCWNTEADGTGTDYTEGSIFVMGTSNVTLYAKWTTIQVTEITLDKESLKLLKGKTAKLTATVYPDDATNQELEWTSSDESIVKVDGEGNLEAIGAGVATITCTSTDGSDISAYCEVTVIKPILVTNVQLNKTSLSLVTGKTEILKATVSPSNATNKTLIWTSSNTKVAKVDSNGKVTEVGLGTTNIICKASDGSNKTAICKVTVVKPILATNIQLNKASLSLVIGKAETLKATVSPSNTTNKTVTWTSSNTKVAKVDNNGKVTAVSKGITTITCRTNDGSNKSVTCKITVTEPIKVTSIKLSNTNVLLKVGKTSTLTATIAPSSATDKTVTWKSSNSNVATVDSTGKITAKKTGTVTITATANDGSNKTTKCIVTVIK